VAILLSACGQGTSYPVWFDFKVPLQEKNYETLRIEIETYAKANGFSIWYNEYTSKPTPFLTVENKPKGFPSGISISYAIEYGYAKIWFMEQGFENCADLGKAILKFHNQVLTPLEHEWELVPHEIHESKENPNVIWAKCQNQESVKEVLELVLPKNFEPKIA